MKKLISIILAVMMTLSTGIFSAVYTSALESTLSYSFSGDEKLLAGYAQGTVSFNADEQGKYYLYWANEQKALDGYYEIASFELSQGQTGEFTFSDHTAIPVGAKKVIASLSPSCDDALTADAVASFEIPEYKKLSYSEQQRNYRYAAFSDIHTDMQGGGFDTYYKNSVPHFEKALADCVSRDVDFVITAGDDVTNASGSTLEWMTYQQTIADSDYVNPIYESIGNHETRYSKYTDCAVTCGIEEYITATGLATDKNSANSDKSYFEVTQKDTGDHFIFMSIENATDPNLNDVFSDAQMAWLENLLNKYSTDGNKIFIIQHAPFKGYGAGDDNADPGYNGGLRTVSDETGEPYKNNQKFKDLLEEYPDVVWFSGHTHLDFAENKNFSNENDTSCNMFHIPSCCNTTRLSYNAETNARCLDYTFYEDTSQGFFVDVFDDVSIYYGANLYYNKLYPAYTYITGEDSSVIPPSEVPTEVPSETQKPTETQIPSETQTPTETQIPSETQTPTETQIPSETQTPTETQPPTESPYPFGDADLSGDVSIMDVTLIQRYLAKMDNLSEQQLALAKVSGAPELSIIDATYIQKFLAELISVFPGEKPEAKTELALTGAITNEELSLLAVKCKEYLDSYFQYASYDSYQALKKVFYKYKDVLSTISTSEVQSAYSALEAAFSDFSSLREKVKIQTVYFTDAYSMGNVKAYYWKNTTLQPLETWPGQQATYIATNSMSQNVYAVTIDFAKYQNIIFNNNGTNQTKDIALDGKSGKVYYPNATDPVDGKYTVGVSTYKKMWVEEQPAVPVETITIYFTNTQSWSKINCYYWSSTSSGTWPGQEMKFVRNSSTGKGIYSISLPSDSSVVFNNGSGEQTEDVVTVANNQGYYPSTKNTSGKWSVTSYSY